jgi:hypothetical protein
VLDIESITLSLAPSKKPAISCLISNACCVDDVLTFSRFLSFGVSTNFILIILSPPPQIYYVCVKKNRVGMYLPQSFFFRHTKHSKLIITIETSKCTRKAFFREVDCTKLIYFFTLQLLLLILSTKHCNILDIKVTLKHDMRREQ